MGVDITLSIINGEELVAYNIFEGRNSEWFSNLSGNMYSKREYDFFPKVPGLPEEIPERISKDVEYDCYYGFFHIPVDEFIKWYQKYKPQLTAGWVSTYNAWLYNVKNILPEESCHIKPESASKDFVFMEFEDIYDCSKWLYDFLLENNISESDTIIYYFDC